jgi:hypothetical protein
MPGGEAARGALRVTMQSRNDASARRKMGRASSLSRTDQARPTIERTLLVHSARIKSPCTIGVRDRLEACPTA